MNEGSELDWKGKCPRERLECKYDECCSETIIPVEVDAKDGWSALQYGERTWRCSYFKRMALRLAKSYSTLTQAAR